MSESNPGDVPVEEQTQTPDDSPEEAIARAFEAVKEKAPKDIVVSPQDQPVQLLPVTYNPSQSHTVTRRNKRESRATKIVKAAGYDQWGYIVFRGSYDDNKRWKEYERAFADFIQRDMDRRTEKNGVVFDPEMRGRLRFLFFDDVSLGVNDTRGCARWYRSLKGNKDQVFPKGLDVGFCLWADEGSIDSLLDRTVDSVPYVIAVDTKNNPDDPKSLERGYEGCCQVALSALIEELYPVFEGGCLTLREVYMFANPILRWIG